MTLPEIVPVIGFAGAPEVRLFDARATDLDESELRAWVRAECNAAGAPYVARSYRFPLALAAWHSEPVGVDIERIGPCDEAFADSIRTPSELADPAVPDDPDAYITSLWCSKEALSKALGDATRYDPRRLDSPARWPDRQAGPWRAAELAVAADHTAWLCWRVTSPENAFAV